MSLGNGFVNSTIICNARKEVDLDALNLMASAQSDVFCVCRYKNENKHHMFVYDTNDLINLKYLKAGLSFENVIEILSAALKIIQFVSDNNLVLDNVKSSKDYIFRSDDGYKFVYLPITHKSHISARDFLMKLFTVLHHKDIRLVRLVKELHRIKDDATVISRLNSFVFSYVIADVEHSEDATSLLGVGTANDISLENTDSDSSYEETSHSEMEINDSQNLGTAFANEGETTFLSNDNDNENTSQDEAVDSQPDDDAIENDEIAISNENFANEGETTLLNQVNDSNGDSESKSDDLDEQQPNSTDIDLQHDDPVIDYDEVKISDDGETTVLSQSSYDHVIEMLGNSGYLTQRFEDLNAESETTVLSSQPAVVSQRLSHEIDSEYYLYLVRSINGEKVTIDITPFTIGKDASSVDYVLNSASVSRHHATIIHENGGYFIVDNGSTNGTTIEGIRLQPEEKGEIGNGYIIAIGNESFQAHIERR